MKKLFEKYDANKLKANLKMAVARIGLLRNKRLNAVKVQRRQIAELLLQQKDESARIKVEGVIRDDYLLEALDILELLCEMTLARIQLISECKSSSIVPHDMREALSTLIYATPRVEIKELTEVRHQFQLKFGRDFVDSSMSNRDLTVNQRVMFKLGIKVPEPFLCVEYMKEIAREHNIEWDESSIMQHSGSGGSGSSGSSGSSSSGGGMPAAASTTGNAGISYLPQAGGGGAGGGVDQFAPSVAAYLGGGAPEQPYYANNNAAKMDSMPMQQMQQMQQPPAAPPVYNTGLETPGFAAEGFRPHNMSPAISPTTAAALMPGLPSSSASPSIDVGGDAAAAAGGPGPEYDFDDLQRRFEALKNRQ